MDWVTVCCCCSTIPELDALCQDVWREEEEEELWSSLWVSFLIGPIRFSLFFSGQPQELIRLSGIQEQGAATATAVVASREEDGCASLMLIKKYPRLGRRRRGGGVK
jgi:hypothetical protein